MKKVFRTLSMIAAAILLCSTNATASLTDQWTIKELEVVDLVNLQRKHSGLSDLTMDNRLQKAADLHSEDMARRDFFDHVNPDQKDHTHRIAAQKYNYSTRRNEWPRENIAVGFNGANSDSFSVMYGTDDMSELSEFGVSRGKGEISDWSEVGLGWTDEDWMEWGDMRDEKDLNTGWMGSDGHRDSILHENMTDIGVGHYYDDGDGPWDDHWTQVFATGDSANPSPVPIPPAILLFGTGMMWVVGWGRSKRKLGDR